MTKLLLTIIMLLLMLEPVHCESHLTWTLDGRQSTPYLVEKDYLSGDKTVYNLRTGEVGMEIKGFGTLQTGRHLDTPMEMILRDDADNQGDSED